MEMSRDVKLRLRRISGKKMLTLVDINAFVVDCLTDVPYQASQRCPVKMMITTLKETMVKIAIVRTEIKSIISLMVESNNNKGKKSQLIEQ